MAYHHHDYVPNPWYSDDEDEYERNREDNLEGKRADRFRDNWRAPRQVMEWIHGVGYNFIFPAGTSLEESTEAIELVGQVPWEFYPYRHFVESVQYATPQKPHRPSEREWEEGKYATRVQSINRTAYRLSRSHPHYEYHHRAAPHRGPQRYRSAPARPPAQARRPFTHFGGRMNHHSREAANRWRHAFRDR